MRAALLRFFLLVGLGAVGLILVRWGPLAGHFTGDGLSAALAELRVVWWAPLVHVGLYLVLSPLGAPVSPLILAGGLVFGTAWGALYNFIGTMLGALASYLLALALGRDLVRRLAGEGLLQKVEPLLARHGFWALVRVRFFPIPFVVTNFSAALVGISLPTFLAASAAGLAPSMLIYTYFGEALFRVATEDRRTVLLHLFLAVGLILLLTFVAPRLKSWVDGRRGG